MNGFLGRDTPILVIADDAAEQTVVCCRDVIVIVQKNRGQRRSIYSEYLLLRDVSRQFRVQCMNALYHQHIVIVHLQLVAALFTLSALEIILRQFYLLTTEEGVELLVDQIEIQGIDALIIIFARSILRRFLPIYEIIIERNLERFQSVYGKLYAQTLARSGLARRRRTCQQHQFHALAAGNLLSNLGNLLLLQRLADIDDVGRMIGIYRLVKIAYSPDAQDTLPAMMLLEYLKHLVLSGHFAQHIRVLERRNAQEHAIIIFLQPEEIELRGIGEQRAVVIIYIITYFIIGSIDRARCLEQFHLLNISFLLKQRHSLFGRHGEPAYRHPGIDNLLHATADDVHIFIYNRSAQADIYVETIRYGDINHHICSRINVLYRLAENKEEGTGICTRTG